MNPPKICDCGSTSVKETCEYEHRVYRWCDTHFAEIHADGSWYFECAECGKELSDEEQARLFQAL